MTTLTYRFPLAPARLGFAVLAILSTSVTMAADDGWYGGVSVGRSQADLDNASVVADMLSTGFTTTSLTDFEDDNGYKLFTGYQFNRNFAIEGGYVSLGEFGYMAELNPLATRRGDTRMMALNIDLVGILPMTDKLSAFGKIGTAYGQSREQFSGHGPVTITRFSNREREMDYTYGAGFQYDVTPQLGMRIEAERFTISNNVLRNDNVDLFSLGVVYRFGAKAAPAAAAPTPAPRAAAAAPRATPAPAPAPAAPPAPTRVTFSADSVFDFDSAAVKPAGRTELDKLANDLRGVDFDTIVVTGHTDRLGSPAYNLTLSQRRADAVKDYLVQSANIAAGKITTRGVNGAEPVTTSAQCGSGMARAALITCLAPDRRVEVEVSGTRPR
jgi:OOP family OmpA-OmpF porin